MISLKKSIAAVLAILTGLAFAAGCGSSSIQSITIAPSGIEYRQRYPVIVALPNDFNNLRDILLADGFVPRQQDAQDKDDSIQKYVKGNVMFSIKENEDAWYTLLEDPSVIAGVETNEKECLKMAESFARKYFGLPENAHLSAPGAFFESAENEAADETSTLVAYAFECQQTVNGLPVDWNFMHVSVNDHGVDFACIRWDEFRFEGEAEIAISESKAIMIAMLKQHRYMRSFSNETAIVLSTELVYSNAFTGYGELYVPVWLVHLNWQHLMLINASDGEIKYLIKLHPAFL
jgi:hypothetical protein